MQVVNRVFRTAQDSETQEDYTPREGRYFGRLSYHRRSKVYALGCEPIDWWQNDTHESAQIFSESGRPVFAVRL